MPANPLQTTVAGPVSWTGCGIHTGAPARVTVRPRARPGIVFRRVDGGLPGAECPALWSHLVPSSLCTCLAGPDGRTIRTVEHLLAALGACGIQAAQVDVDGPELPGLDGSALPFIHGLRAAGRHRIPHALTALRILRTVAVRGDGGAVARLSPWPGFRMRFDIDFRDAAIGRQSLVLDLSRDGIRRELADCRTFCQISDLARMRAQGCALGGSPETAVVVDGSRILTPGGLRRADEPVRHKMLDAAGDLMLAGHPVIGHYAGIRAGHALTHRLLAALLGRDDCAEVIECDRETAHMVAGGAAPDDDISDVA